MRNRHTYLAVFMILAVAEVTSCPPEKVYLDEYAKPKPAKFGIY